MGAAFVARVRFDCAGFGVRMGLGAQSWTTVVLGCRFGTRLRFEGTGSGAWVGFVSAGPGKRVGFVDTGSGAWVKFVGNASGDWVKSEGIGIKACVRVDGTRTEANIRFEGTGAGAWVRFESAGIDTRLGFGSGVGRPAEPVIRAKVLPTSGDSTEVGLLGTLTVSKVLVRLRVSRVWEAVRLSEMLAVGVEGPDIDVIFGGGVVSTLSAKPSMLVI